MAWLQGAASIGGKTLGDVMLKYKGDIGDFSVVARGGYGWSNDPGSLSGQRLWHLRPRRHAVHLSQHQRDLKAGFPMPLGRRRLDDHAQSDRALFVYGGWGQITATTDHVFPAGTVFLPTSNMFFLQPGIERKWISLGKTNIFGEYRHDDSGSSRGPHGLGQRRHSGRQASCRRSRTRT